MEREEPDRIACRVCGELTTPGVDEAFAWGGDDVLCHACAIARGGVFDPEEERWTQPPRIDDLLTEEG